MMSRKIILMGMAFALSYVGSMQSSMAGFEFIAPKQQASPEPRVSNPAWQAPQTVMPPMPAPMMAPAPVMAPPVAPPVNSYQPPAAPPAPVMQAPLTNVMPQPMAQPMPSAPVQNMVRAPRSSGLVIDPYPLRNNQSARLTPSHQAVATTMAETGGALTPVQLGAGMTTGVKAGQLQNNPVEDTPRPPQRLAGSSSLTPIPGGEPAPLPNVDLELSQVGMEQAYYDPAFVPPAPVQYANAVGFAREIPLSIALEQVIPEGFIPRFVDVPSQSDLMVSWEGGEPWNKVLNNMLRPHNLTATITGQSVTIRPMARS